LIWRIPFRDGERAVWIYVLVEHQSTPDPMMGFRLLCYMVELWRTQVRQWADERLPESQWRLDPIVPFVLYTGERRWTTPVSVAAMMDLPEMLEAFVPAFKSLMLRVQETPPEALGRSGMAGALRGLQGLYTSEAGMASALDAAMRLLAGLSADEVAEWERALRFLLALVLKGRSAEERERLLEVMLAGLDAGHRARADRLLLHVGTKRLGQPDDEVRQAIEAVGSVEALEALADRVMEVETWAALMEGVARP
jgi:hypothetical protein